MRRDHMAGLEVWLAGGTDGRGGGEGPLVVLLHGYGAPGDDLTPLAAELPLPNPVRFLFPAAPLSLAEVFFESRAWWMVDWARREHIVAARGVLDLSDDEPVGLDAARDRIRALLDAARDGLGADPAATVLGGFSQGAMLACDVALEDPRPLAGLVLLSPTLIRRGVWEARAPGRAGLPVFMSHGRQDPVLAFPMAERLRDLLVGAGLDVVWRPFDGGHGIDPPVVRDLAGFLRGVLGPAG